MRGNTKMRFGHWLLITGIVAASCTVIGVIGVVIFYAAGDTTDRVFGVTDNS